MDQKFRLLQLRALSIALGFGTALILAHALGADGYGRFEATVAWATLGATLVLGGAQRFTVREIARSRAANDDAAVAVWSGAFARHLGRRVLVVIVAAAVLALALYSSGREDLAIRLAVALVVFAPLLVRLQQQQAILQGLEHPVHGQMAEFCVLPAVLFAGAAALDLTGTVRLPMVLATYGLAALAGVVTATALLRRAGEPSAGTDADAGGETLQLGRLVRVFLWLEVIRILDARIDLLFLDVLGESTEAGQFATASRLANLCAIVLLAANTVLAPKLARHHAAGEHLAMQRLLTSTARATLALSIPITVVVVAFGPSILELLGSDFGPAERPLWILLGAQLVNVAAGSAGLLLQMAGHEKRVLAILAVTTLAHLIASAVLIPRLGALGAAIATGLSVVAWNLALAVSARRICRLDSTALGLWPAQEPDRGRSDDPQA